MNINKSDEYLNAWITAISLYPDYWLSDTCAISEITSIHEVRPSPYKKWKILFEKESSGGRIFLMVLLNFLSVDYNVSPYYSKEYETVDMIKVFGQLDNEKLNIISTMLLNFRYR